MLLQLARDLIPRMLVVDPMKRITIPEIRRHPWFTHKLPSYLSRPPFKIEKEVRGSCPGLLVVLSSSLLSLLMLLVVMVVEVVVVVVSSATEINRFDHAACFSLIAVVVIVVVFVVVASGGDGGSGVFSNRNQAVRLTTAADWSNGLIALPGLMADVGF